jgi:hypothetical protein
MFHITPELSPPKLHHEIDRLRDWNPSVEDIDLFYWGLYGSSYEALGFGDDALTLITPATLRNVRKLAIAEEFWEAIIAWEMMELKDGTTLSLDEVYRAIRDAEDLQTIVIVTEFEIKLFDD